MITDTLKILEKKYGKGIAFKLNDSPITGIPVISTGSYNLDIALGVGGLPRGRIVEFYGPEGAGKSTLCQHVVKEAQLLGGMAAFIDVEHALDSTWVEKSGVNFESLYVIQPDTGEQALDVAEALVKSGDIDVVIVDSVAALTPRAEIEGEIGDAHIGLQARLMSQALRRLSSAVSDSNCVLIFTNQLRQKIGGSTFGFGDNTTTTGGMALRFYASIRIQLKPSKWLQEKEGGEPIGIHINADIKKNKVAPPFKKTSFLIRYGEGIDKLEELIELGKNLGVVEYTQPWFNVKGKKYQGVQKFREALKEDQKLILTLEDAVRSHLGLPLWRIKE
jgi:recombination protein RecA